jgi:hypothetical protein
MYYIILAIFIYFSQVYILYFQNEPIQMMYFDYDHVKPFKNSFFWQNCLEFVFLYAQKMHFVFVT